MIVKIHPTPNGRMLAICDSELLGKVFEEDDKQLNLDSQFYKGEEMPEDKLKEIIKTCYVINAVGKESTGFLLKEDMIKEENIMEISGIPHTQCVIEH
ncbi:DUF424 domain-containing protein [Nanoarchaeota archaeon]